MEIAAPASNLHLPHKQDKIDPNELDKASIPCPRPQLETLPRHILPIPHNVGSLLPPAPQTGLYLANSPHNHRLIIILERS